MLSRCFRFLAGRRNFVGTALALLGLGLFFAGIIKKYWGLIVLGLYLLGVLLTPPERAELVRSEAFDTDQVEEALGKLMASIKKHVKDDAILQRIEAIRDSIVAILPPLAESNEGLNSHDLHVVRETVFEYLPTMLESYLKLPAAFARKYPVKDGKPPRTLLLEQLDLLDVEMKKIVIDVHQQNTSALVAHGRFLQEKFGKNEWE
jgi:hypothetical protein